MKIKLEKNLTTCSNNTAVLCYDAIIKYEVWAYDGMISFLAFFYMHSCNVIVSNKTTNVYV